jgi:hypothetical protein
MPEEQEQGTGSKILGGLQDLILTIGLGYLTKDPFAYPRFKMGMESNRLENLHRVAQNKRYADQERRLKETEARLKQPVESLYPMQQVTKPEALAGVGAPFDAALPSGFEPPATPVETARSPVPVPRTFEDIPGALALANLAKKEEVPMHGFDPEHDVYQGGKLIKPGVPKVKEDPVKFVKEDDEGNLINVHSSGKTSPVRRGTAGEAWKGVPFALPTGLEQVKAKKAATKLSPVEENRGDAYRKGTYNPETGEYKWGDWTNKRPAPEKAEKGLTPGRRKTMYANYNVARTKSKFDPLRIAMEEDFRKDNIPVPEFMPELSPQEFDTLIDTGKLPGKKATAGPTKDNPPPITPEKKGYASFEGKKTPWYWDGKKWEWIEGK